MGTHSQRGQVVLEMIWFLIFILGFFVMYLTWGQNAKRTIGHQQESKETLWYKR